MSTRTFQHVDVRRGAVRPRTRAVLCSGRAEAVAARPVVAAAAVTQQVAPVWGSVAALLLHNLALAVNADRTSAAAAAEPLCCGGGAVLLLRHRLQALPQRLAQLVTALTDR